MRPPPLRSTLLMAFGVALLGLAGCASARGAALATAAKAPTTTMVMPTLGLASPAVTALATITPAATATPSATPAPTGTPAPTDTPTATPAGRIGPGNLPAGVNPLTGEVVPDPALLAHRPLAIKIVNEPACARPQHGLNQAAVVFEHYVEAWGTRFTAIFYGQPAARVGAVRSARLIDLELPAIFDAAFAFSGSSGGVKQRLQASDFAARVIASEWKAPCPPLCRVPVESVGCADLEHSLFTNVNDLQAHVARLGLDQRPALEGWAFSAAPLAPGEPAPSVRVGYLNSPVDWRYDAASGSYLRSQDGQRQIDAATRTSLSAQTVVVLFAHHLFSDIRESTNFYSLEIQFWGQGPALVFRDGQAYRGHWQRPNRAGLFQIVDETGEPIPLKPGRTWFELVALDSAVAESDGRWTIAASVLPQQTPPRP